MQFLEKMKLCNVAWKVVSILYPLCRHTLGSAPNSFLYACLRVAVYFESRLALWKKEESVERLVLLFLTPKGSESPHNMRGSRSRLPARSALNALHRRAAPRLVLLTTVDDRRYFCVVYKCILNIHGSYAIIKT